jgi:glutathione S-transferase
VIVDDDFALRDDHLWFREQEGLDWVGSSGHPTIADIATFPDVMLCEEGGISRLEYPAIRDRRIGFAVSRAS